MPNATVDQPTSASTELPFPTDVNDLTTPELYTWIDFRICARRGRGRVAYSNLLGSTIYRAPQLREALALLARRGVIRETAVAGEWRMTDAGAEFARSLRHNSK